MENSTDENAPAPTPPPNDASGGNGGDQQAQLEAAFTSAAVNDPAADAAPAPKRKPGQRGPDKAPRKKVPVGKVDHGPGEALFTEAPRTVVPVEFENPVPPVDDTALRLGIEGAFQMLETGAVVFVGTIAKREGVSETFAEKCREGVKPEPAIRKAMIDGGVLCWKKYFPNTPIGPEVVLLGAIALWGRQIKEVVDTLKAEGAKLTTQPAA